MMDIKPIKNDADYEAALEEIERLFNAEPDTPEGDRLKVLVTLVEAFEAKHYDIPPPDPIEAIKYYMESRGLSRRDLEPYIGSRARVSEILNRRRPLSLRMIRNLEAGLGIPAEILIRPCELDIPRFLFEAWEERQAIDAEFQASIVVTVGIRQDLAQSVAFQLVTTKTESAVSSPKQMIEVSKRPLEVETTTGAQSATYSQECVPDVNQFYANVIDFPDPTKRASDDLRHKEMMQ